MAYAKALVGMGIVTKEESEQLCEGLEKIKGEWEAGRLVLDAVAPTPCVIILLGSPIPPPPTLTARVP